MKKTAFKSLLTIVCLTILSLCLGGCKKSFLKSIGIANLDRIQTEYYTSDTFFAFNDAQIVLIYSDDTTKNVDLEASMLSYFDNTVGTHTATITYEGKTTTFSYTVEAVKVEKIELISNPKTNYYTSSTSFELLSAQIKVTYNDGSTRNVNLEADMLSAFENTVGTHTATITYEGKITTFSYTVEAVKVEKIELISNPKTNYYTSSTSFELSTSQIKVTYNDGSTRNVSLEASMLSSFNDTIGTHTATITYEGKTTTFSYTVEAVNVDRIELISNPKTNYYTSSTSFELLSAQIKVTYNDGSTRNVNLEASMLSLFNNTVGTHTATITYEGKTTTFSYTVEGVSVDRIELISNPKTNYYTSSTSFELSTSQIKVTYNDGSTRNVSLEASMLSSFNDTIGTHTATITYEGKTTIFEYSVEAVVAVTINLVEGVVTEYLVGDNLSLNNPIIYFTNNDGSNGNVDLTIDLISNFSTSSAGQMSMTITYQSATYNLPYTVYHKDYISSSFVNVSTEAESDMPMIFMISKLDIQGNSITIKYKENDTSLNYQTLTESTTSKTFTIKETQYTLDLGAEISLSDGTNKYIFSPVLEAKKVNVQIGKNVDFYYVGLDNISKKVTYTQYEVFYGEKIVVYPDASEGYVVTEITYGTKNWNFGYSDRKYAQFYAYKNINVYANVEEATRVSVTFKLKTIDYYDHTDDYGLGQQYEYVGNLVSNGFYVNNSALTQGVINVESDFCFTDAYQDGCLKGEDVSTGEICYVEKTYTWTITTSITTNTWLYLYIGVSGRVTYPIDSTSVGGSKGKDVSFKINKDDSSTFVQEDIVDDFNSRFKLVLEITVEAL